MMPNTGSTVCLRNRFRETGRLALANCAECAVLPTGSWFVIDLRGCYCLGRGTDLTHFQPVIIGLIRFSFFQSK